MAVAAGIAGMLAMILLVGGCSIRFAAPSPTPTPSPTTPARPTATTPPTRTAAPAQTPTAIPTARPTDTATPHPRWTATPTPLPTPIVVTQGIAAGNLIALTFDCGADRGAAPAILDFLRQQGIYASFGVTGLWAAQNPDLVRRMAAQGEQIMDHTYDHRSFTGFSTHTAPLSRAGIADELEWADAAIRHITGSSTRPYFRSPYGDESPAARAAAAAEGYNVDVRWTVDSLGWAGLAADQIVARVRGMATPGGIILMHVGAASQDATALPRIVAGLRAHGYRFVTVAALLAADHRRGAPHPAAPLTYRAVDPAAVYYPGTSPGPLSGYVVLLDPGHGGDDPGTCYPLTVDCYPQAGTSATPELPEKTVALDVALYHLLPRLHLLGADVYLTRTTLGQDPDLEQRLRLANDVARVRQVRRHALFISLHLNGADDPTVDYTQALYAAHSSRRLATTLDAAIAAALQPAPNGGDHGVDSFPGRVLRHNRLPATIVEPAFLTNVSPVAVPISVTRIVTATAGAALRRGLRLFRPVVRVAVRLGHAPHAPSLTVREAFSGTVPLRRAITLARTDAISTLLATRASGTISLTAPPSATVPAAPAVSPGVTYAISVSGAVSATSLMTTVQGEGPWLARAHAATQRLNAGYDAPEPARLSLRYAWNDREESLARGLLRGIAAFFHVPLPHWALRPRDAPVNLDAVVPPG
jgi:peptidoglycan-N-acetylglucosamine deacetylase